MNRIIKFRVWHKEAASMSPEFSILEVGEIPYSEEDLEFMQFTGIQDIDKKDIFEGDIVFVDDCWDGDYKEHKFIGEVKFEDGCFLVQGRNNSIMNYEELDNCAVHNRKIKVVGNIFENSGMLLV